MTSGRGSVGRLAMALAAVVALVAGQPAPAAFAEPAARTYAGPAYNSEFPIPPTATENQSKLWFHADAWWALLMEPTGRQVRVHELMPNHTWRPTPVVINADTGGVGDAVQAGDVVHTVTRDTADRLLYVRLTYDPAARDYRADAPVLITTRGSQAPAAIAQDSGGTLWVGYATATNMVVIRSEDGGVTWGRETILANTGTGNTPEMAAMIAYDDQVGVLWSDQNIGAFEFASHRAGDEPNVWSRTQALAGPAQADNHISLVRIPGEPSDTLVAAIKTSQGDQGEPLDSPLIQVLIRTPDGRWDAVPVSTIADGLNDPVLQVDLESRTLYLIASAEGNIVTKRASLDDLRFPPGIGTTLVVGTGGVLADPTVTKGTVDSRSGLVVLASDTARWRYRHAEIPLTAAAPVPDPDDNSPPEPPSGLQGRVVDDGTVVLSWGESSDGNRWVPASSGVPVREYVVMRDGVQISALTSTTLRDDSALDPDAPAETTVEYQVLAVDQAGNRSAAATVLVSPPAADPFPATAIGVGLLALGSLAGIYALVRPRLRRA